MFKYCSLSFRNFTVLKNYSLSKLSLDVLFAFIKEKSFSLYYDEFINDILIPSLKNTNDIYSNENIFRVLSEIFEICDSPFKSETKIQEFLHSIVVCLSENDKNGINDKFVFTSSKKKLILFNFLGILEIFDSICHKIFRNSGCQFIQKHQGSEFNSCFGNFNHSNSISKRKYLLPIS